MDLLDSERHVAKVVNTLLLGAIVTGFLLFVFEGHSQWRQWSQLLHVVLVVPLSLFMLPYFYLHFRRTLGFRRAGVLFSGLALLLVFLVVAGTGLHTLYFGQSERLAWIPVWHWFASFSFVGLLVLHIVLHIQFFPERRKASEAGRFPSYTEGQGKQMVLLNLALQISLVVFTMLFPAPLLPEASAPAVADYQYRYGEHPFRPSQTEVVHGGFVSEDDIANSFNCMNCHEQIGKQWIASMHQQAASDPTYVTNITLLVENKGIAAARYCEGCHAPVALLTGELSPGGEHGGIAETPAHIEGVSCMSCHGISGLVHLKGVGSYEFSPAHDYLFEKQQNAFLQSINNLLIRIDPAQHKRDMGRDLLKDPKVCAACHTQFMDKDMNDWGWVQMQDDYGAWSDSPFSQHHQSNFATQEYVRCQDCHMPLVDSDDPSADDNGKVRAHHFPGANTFLPLLRGDKKQFDETKRFLQANKVRLQIDPPNRKDASQSLLFLQESLRDTEETPYFYYLGEKADIDVVVSNVGVGHNFPAGTIDINEVWIEFRVTDGEGHEVFLSGDIDEAGDVASDSYFYRSIPVDRAGKHVWRHDLFNMVGESFKRVIKAGESDIARFSFFIPPWVKSPLTVSARIRYRKLNNQYARWALKEKYFAIPAVDMAWDSLVIPIKIRKEVETNTQTYGN